ncbi:MAG: Hsp20 family protein [Pseudomonadota bacterium]
MANVDLSPLFRYSVGFDRLDRLMENALKAESVGPTYPPYNIEKTGDDTYRVTLAVAGFGESDLDITVKENSLTVSGKIDRAANDSAGEFLHRGIAGRAFERHFQIADHIVVTGASLENGLLHVDLVREVPEALKPRRIEIAGSGRKRLTKKAA